MLGRQSGPFGHLDLLVLGVIGRVVEEPLEGPLAAAADAQRDRSPLNAAPGLRPEVAEQLPSLHLHRLRLEVFGRRVGGVAPVVVPREREQGPAVDVSLELLPERGGFQEVAQGLQLLARPADKLDGPLPRPLRALLHRVEFAEEPDEVADLPDEDVAPDQQGGELGRGFGPGLDQEVEPFQVGRARAGRSLGSSRLRSVSSTSSSSPSRSTIEPRTSA